MKLIIVESPAKGQTIQKFLGPEYKVLASFGHIRDLPKDKLGIDIENDFEPEYVIPAKAKKTITALKKAVKKSDSTILATDEDREGEAIAWHLVQALGLDETKNKKQKTKNYERIVFHEITKQAIEEALKNPRDIDIDLVDSQQARRILDRLVGYKLSPFLWKKVARGLSAGRVQSVAVKLVCEREKEIKDFKPQEYWEIEALFSKSKKEFTAFLVKKEKVKSEKETDIILKNLESAEYKVINIEKKEVRRNPLPPFATSTLQQTAWQKFHWPARMTMSIAQHLYENGLITYHRTDSLNLSGSALGAAKNFITKNFGENYYQSRRYKTKAKGAQEAHEAVRPSYADKTPDSLNFEGPQSKLYALIWQRFIACQMAPAIFDSTAVEIKAGNYTFRASGQTLKFDGFLKVYSLKFSENELPPLEINEFLKLIELTPSQHFTEPPPRYNEASLIKVLEENGIGRPSTYAPTLSTVQERNYIEKDEQKRFRPTEIGAVVNDLLVNNFPEIVDIQFTAKMEKDLDDISDNKREWVPVIKEFYGPFAKNLEEKYKKVKKEKVAVEKTDKTCPKCGAPLLIRLGRYGKFYACSTFPKCKFTKSLEKPATLNIVCPKCGKGKIVEKRTKARKIFYGCDQYPKCDFALWDKPTGKKCPKCQSLLAETKRKQIKCSNKECSFVLEK